MTPERNHLAGRQRALAEIRDDVARRIRPMCAGWREEDTERLIDRMAEIKYRYERLQDAWLPAIPPEKAHAIQAATRIRGTNPDREAGPISDQHREQE